ncbi:serine/arginine-rich splicing factor SC35-like isoform X2 [Andrographis paniculata]|uniref:serine/arginine-rich splicing factor SC35-like isoform X2 n=1 Tax=Andrographis paniculata TaxID=175694 RepID=UPI0021E7E2AF|nr:serine/arginine-rich splicing factor SC35-like isoform X2 [Andrographis paniculata]
MADARAVAESYSLLVLNVNFRTTSDDLFPLFSKYGKVMEVYIPRDRRTGESRGFAFVRNMHKDEAQKAMDKLDGRVVDGREIAVQFANYGPRAEPIHEGRIVAVSRGQRRSRSRSPRRRYEDDYHGDRDYRRGNQSRSFRGYEQDRYEERDPRYWYRSRSYSPDYDRGRERSRYDDGQQSRLRSYERSARERSRYDDGQQSWLRSYERSARKRSRYDDGQQSRLRSYERSLSPRGTRSPRNGHPMRRGFGSQ